MRKSNALVLAGIAVLALAAAFQTLPAAAEEMAAEEMAPSGLKADLLASLDEVEEKLVGLAEAIPQEKYSWRPAEGVRSVSETLMHVTLANFFLPSLLGVEMPEGITREMEKEVTAKEEVVAKLQESFAHARETIMGVPEATLDEMVSFGGSERSKRAVLLLIVSHGHEHLGQGIAYARSIGVVPPWSQGG